MNGGQGFHIQVPLGVPSQAERTLVKYEAPGEEPPKNPFIPPGCFGCKGPHPWMTGGKIVCPFGNDPRVKANADKEYAAYKTRRAETFRGRSDDRTGLKKKTKRT